MRVMGAVCARSLYTARLERTAEAILYKLKPCMLATYLPG